MTEKRPDYSAAIFGAAVALGIAGICITALLTGHPEIVKGVLAVVGFIAFIVLVM